MLKILSIGENLIERRTFAGACVRLALATLSIGRVQGAKRFYRLGVLWIGSDGIDTSLVA